MIIDENPASLHINRCSKHTRSPREVFAARTGARTTGNLNFTERITTFSRHAHASLSAIHPQSPLPSKIDKPRFMRQKVELMGGYQVAGQVAAVSIRAHRF